MITSSPQPHTEQVPDTKPCCPCGNADTPRYCTVNDQRCPCRARVQPDGYGGPCTPGYNCEESAPARAINARQRR